MSEVSTNPIRDLGSFGTAFREFFQKFSEYPGFATMSSGSDSVQVAARAAFKNWLEESLETLGSQYDLTWTVRQPGFLGVLARGLESVAHAPEQVLLIPFTLLAGVIEAKKIGGPFSPIVSSVFNALPKALPKMFSGGAANADTIEQQLRVVARATGYERIVQTLGHGYGALAAFASSVKLALFAWVDILANREVDGDHGLGLEGSANRILIAHAHALTHDAKGLEKLIPDDPAAVVRLRELAGMDRAQIEQEKIQSGQNGLLPASIQEYIANLLAAYRVDHPMSHIEARAHDWLDSWIDRLPPGLRPKKKGWAGVSELFSWRNAAIALSLLCVLMIPVGIVLALVAKVVLAVAQHLSNGVAAIALFLDPFMAPVMFETQYYLVSAWFLAVILGAGEWFNLATRRYRKKVRDLSKEELDKLSFYYEPIRQRTLTIRVVVAVIGLVVTIIGLGVGYFEHLGVGTLLAFVWLAIFLAEASLKWEHHLTRAFINQGLLRTVTTLSWVAVALAVVSMLLFGVLNPDGNPRPMTATVMQAVETRVQTLAKSGENPNRDCAEGLRNAAAEAKRLGYSLDQLCRVITTSPKFPEKFPCDCPR
jgi:hypothetical protein